MRHLWAILLILVIGCAGERSSDAPTRVIVVGAGLAGLASARVLHDQGFDVTVLEARDSVGGRTRTLDLAGANVDAGAAWIHGDEQNPLALMADALGIEYRYHDLEADVMYYDEQAGPVSEDVIDAADEVAAAVYDATTPSPDADVSFAAWVDQWFDRHAVSAAVERTARFFLMQGGVEIDISAPAERISTAWLDHDEAFFGGDHLPVGGYRRFVDVLAQGLDIRTSEPVRHIYHDADGVVLTTDRGTHAASHVIVTVPLGVLKSGTLTFDPPLPASKQRAIERLEMGNLEKVILRFSTAFWREQGVRGVGWIGHRTGVLTGEYPDILDVSDAAGGPTLVALYGGGFARSIQGMQSDEKSVQRTLDLLAKALGRDIPAPLASHVTHWTVDPWSLGSYSFIPVGASPKDMEALAEPVAGRVLFAGEATIPDYYQTAHGALLSGMREARRLGASIDTLPGLAGYE